jgi:hypothetical protein
MFNKRFRENGTRENLEVISGKQMYKYETHLHTSETSAFAYDTGADMVKAYTAAGYQGIIVTDHFFNGNTCVPSHLPWERRVELFCQGYENAQKAGDRYGLQVFFGWEYGYDHTDLLTYGLDKTFLLEHPQILSLNITEYAAEVHRHGGFLTHAHPFRKAFYINEIRLFPDIVDAVEVINASHTDPSFNVKARKYADEHRLLYMSGSDAHSEKPLFGGGVAFDRKVESIEDFISTVKTGNYQLLGR